MRSADPMVETKIMSGHYTPRDPSIVSKNMSRVRRSGSSIERSLARAMWRIGLRYRKQYAIPGHPDFAFVRARVAVFCDSHFWHGYQWGPDRRAQFVHNSHFWITKIERNIERDTEVNDLLKNLGWTVIRYWEHEIREDSDRCARLVAQTINRQ